MGSNLLLMSVLCSGDSCRGICNGNGRWPLAEHLRAEAYGGEITQATCCRCTPGWLRGGLTSGVVEIAFDCVLFELGHPSFAGGKDGVVYLTVSRRRTRFGRTRRALFSAWLVPAL